MTDLVVGRDENSSWTYSRQLSDIAFGITAAANTQLTLTVPADMRRALMSYSAGSNVLVTVNQEVTAVPGGAFVSRPNEDLVPTVLDVVPGDVIHIFSVLDAALVFINFYRR